MLRASDLINFRSGSAWNAASLLDNAALIGAQFPERRANALKNTSVKDNSDLRVHALLTALTDPANEVRWNASEEIIKRLVAHDSLITADAHGKLEPPKGGILEQFIQICLDPPINIEQFTDPRRLGRYDPRHGIINTRVMIFRALQHSTAKVPYTTKYLIQEGNVAVSAESHLKKIVEIMYPSPRSTKHRNVLGYTLHELPQAFRDQSISELASLLILCLAGQAQSTNKLAKPDLDHLPATVGTGIYGTILNIGAPTACLQGLLTAIKELAPDPFKGKWIG